MGKRWRGYASYLAILAAAAASIGTGCDEWSVTASSAEQSALVPAQGEVTTAPLIARSNGTLTEIKVSWRAPSAPVRVELLDVDSGERKPFGTEPLQLGEQRLYCQTACPSHFQVVFSNAGTNGAEQAVSFSIQVTASFNDCSAAAPAWLNIEVEE